MRRGTQERAKSVVNVYKFNLTKSGRRRLAFIKNIPGEAAAAFRFGVHSLALKLGT
jgi:hypothetical protein